LHEHVRATGHGKSKNWRLPDPQSKRNSQRSSTQWYWPLSPQTGRESGFASTAGPEQNDGEGPPKKKSRVAEQVAAPDDSPAIKIKKEPDEEMLPFW